MTSTFTFPQVKDRYGISRWTLTRAAEAGELAATKTDGVGRGGLVWAVTRRSFAAWLGAHIHPEGRRQVVSVADLDALVTFEDAGKPFGLTRLQVQRKVRNAGLSYIAVGNTGRWFLPDQHRAFIDSLKRRGGASSPDAGGALDKTRARVQRQMRRRAA